MITEIDRILMIDTETTNDIDCPFVYDVGYQIFSLSEGVLCEKSFVNADIFKDEALMETAFFKDKRPEYEADILTGKRLLRKWYNIKKELGEDCRKYNVAIACAHNASFDNRALNTTQRYITTSKHRYFLPYGIEWWDTLKMARKALKDNEDYASFCWNNEYFTKNMRIRYTAEIIYRWLSQKNDFEESHTGLEDVKIEREIFEYLIKNFPEIDGRLWKMISKVAL